MRNVNRNRAGTQITYILFAIACSLSLCYCSRWVYCLMYVFCIYFNLAYCLITTILIQKLVEFVICSKILPPVWWQKVWSLTKRTNIQWDQILWYRCFDVVETFSTVKKSQSWCCSFSLSLSLLFLNAHFKCTGSAIHTYTNTAMQLYSCFE